MNYLGHAYLSFGNAEVLCGNMIGDFVKGLDALELYPLGIKKGILLHRKIDDFTDHHCAMNEAKMIFRSIYGLYSGAVVDTLMDHFVANDIALFADEIILQGFVQQVYAQLDKQQQYFPSKFHPYFESMVAHNWLFHYRSEHGVQRSLNGLMRRAKHIKEIDSAFRLLQQNKSELQSYYDVFIRDIISFVKIELEVN
ncbi:MAG: ACP phosphodiesterase [Phycisphaerales bacterium]|nr:ACP phosphodiesterase [Phycisphaerales bacterium]